MGKYENKIETPDVAQAEAGEIEPKGDSLSEGFVENKTEQISDFFEKESSFLDDQQVEVVAGEKKKDGFFNKKVVAVTALLALTYACAGTPKTSLSINKPSEGMSFSSSNDEYNKKVMDVEIGASRDQFISDLKVRADYYVNRLRILDQRLDLMKEPEKEKDIADIKADIETIKAELEAINKQREEAISEAEEFELKKKIRN